MDRRRGKRASRDLLVQCAACGASGTGRVVERSLVASGIRGEYDHGTWRHADCGGEIVGFDIIDVAS